MILSRAALWAILIGFFVFTAAAIVLVNRSVSWTGEVPADYEDVQVMDVW